MNGVSLSLDKSNTYLEVNITPQDVSEKLDTKTLLELIEKSDYHEFFLFDENLQSVLNAFRKAIKTDSNEGITQRVAERRHAKIKYLIDETEMSAKLNITVAWGGTNPSLQALKARAKKVGIVRGLGVKRLQQIIKQVEQAQPGDICELLVAKGLPPRNGRSSKLLPLVPNALERILRPQTTSSSRVDMRNLGDVICIKADSEVLRRLPPTQGRAGYTITGVTLDAKGGEWLPFQPGEGTRISPQDDNLLLAAIAGMPKFRDERMWVDDVYICSGVNVGSGNVKYDGAVLVNGDVTEKMTIEASGDVTINGFVESATIKAGGDIIITEGAMGKVNETNTDYSTHLTAEGNVHVQHGQGLDIHCKGNVTIGRQLAYSHINCGGGVTVGPINNPNGNLFACEIETQDQVIAGTLGAVSGSSLSIDFSSGFNQLLERKDSLDDLLEQVKANNERHKNKMDLLKSKRMPPEMRERFEQALNLFNNEAQLLSWMQSKADSMRTCKETYQQDIKLVANKRLYPGVVVRLNNRTWRAEREYAKAKVFYEGHQWQYEPITS